MTVRASIRRTALHVLLCVCFAACDPISTPPQPPWPGTEALRAFDVRPLEPNRAIQMVEAMAFAQGVSHVCGDALAPPRPDSDDDARLREIGSAANGILLAEVDRLHPGAPDNGWAADHILANMLEANLKLGQEAAKARGCEVMAPVETEAWRALRLWRPAAAKDEFSLSIVGLKYEPGERISGFDFKISGGKVVGFPRIPFGWTINITNDPAETSEVYGKAIHGAEFVPPEGFMQMVILKKGMPEESKKYPGEPRTTTVTGYVDLYKPDTMRRVRLSNANFVMSPR